MNPAPADQPYTRYTRRQEGGRTISFVVHIILFFILIIDFSFNIQETVDPRTSSSLFR